MSESETDEQLLERLNIGEVAAFECLFLRHYQRVYRVLFTLVGSREEAEDLAQETFLVLYHNPPRATIGNGLGAWLCRVALNRGYNALRSAKRAQQRIERLEQPPDPADPAAEALRGEEREQVRAILAHLPERQSKLLLLRSAGLSYAEIATTLEIAPGSVGTLLARAERSFLRFYQRTALSVEERAAS